MTVWLRAHWPRLLVLALCILVPMWVFGSIAEDIHERHPFSWEAPFMQALRQDAPGWFRPLALGLSWLGSFMVMLPLCLLLAVLLWRKSRTVGTFFAVALGGALLINIAVKAIFQRARPDVLVRLWTEKDYSFPSGHTTIATALFAALVALFWRTRWRLPLLVVGALYAVLMGLARVYVGVHYPTDVIGGFMSALAWVSGLALVAWPRLKAAQHQAKAPGQHTDEAGTTTPDA